MGKKVIRQDGADMSNLTKKIETEDRIYRDENGDIIETYKEELDFGITVALEPLGDFINMMTESGIKVEQAGFIAERLFGDAKKRILEKIQFIYDNYGLIQIESARYQEGIKGGTMLGVAFTPAGKKG